MNLQAYRPWLPSYSSSKPSSFIFQQRSLPWVVRISYSVVVPSRIMLHQVSASSKIEQLHVKYQILVFTSDIPFGVEIFRR